MEILEVVQKDFDEFIDANSCFWKKKMIKREKGKYIYVDFIMITRDLALMMPKLLYAKALEEVTGAKPIVLDWKYDEKTKQILDSFGIEYVTFHNSLWKQLHGIISAVIYTSILWFHNISGEELKKLQWKSIPVGMHMYEDFIRSSELSTIRTVRNKTVVKKLISMYMFMDSLYRLCKKKLPEICVADDFPYNEGLAVAIMAQFGTKIVQMGTIKKEWMISYDGNKYSKYRHHYLHRYIIGNLPNVPELEYKEWVDNYLNDRFSGKNGVVIDRVAYLNKEVCSRKELAERLNLDPNKKNVIIMAHVFSDATFQSGDIPFRDNYDWTEKTLQFIADIDNVNWIIKLHPARNRYNDSMDSIEALVEKYKSNNVFVFPDEYSSESLLTVADALVTICGTSGIEYTCFGIPAVVVGDAFYNGFGFTNHPKTQEDYFNILSKVDKLEPLSEEQKDMAKKVLFLYGNLVEYTLDDFDKTLSDMFNNRLATGDLSMEYQTKVLNMFTEKIKKEEIENLAYYKLGITFKERYDKKLC